MKDKAAEAWAAWLDTLTSAGKKAVEEKEPVPFKIHRPDVFDDEDVDGFVDLRTGLTEDSREALDKLADIPQNIEEFVDPTVGVYGLVEAQDGEWATMRTFKTAAGLAARLGQLEKQDVVAWPFFGIPLSFTEGPQRYLSLPDGVTAMQIPVYPGGPNKTVPADLLGELSTQEDGFLGPPELANVRIITAKLEGSKKKKQPDEDEDDDEEEDDEK